MIAKICGSLMFVIVVMPILYVLYGIGSGCLMAAQWIGDRWMRQ